MNTPINFALTTAALVSVAFLDARWQRAATRPSWREVALCAVPSLIFCGLVFSLIVHMRSCLGAWPRVFGEDGFPAGLVVHAELAMRCFTALLLTTLLVWPLVLLACLLVRAWRRGAVYLGVHAVAFAVCIALMELAPAPFLSWWWD